MDVIAHRGASAYAPENTLASFQTALRLRAQACEFDVQQSCDNQLVVFHDRNLRRVAHIYKEINQLTLQQLEQIDIGTWFSSSFANERIPTLAQTLQLLRELPTIHLEIKGGKKSDLNFERRIIQALEDSDVWRKTIISSFNHDALTHVRNLRSDARLGYAVVLTPRQRAIREARQLGCESVHIYTWRTNAEWVKQVHQAGMKLNVFTVNSVQQARKLAVLGVDGIFSDRPDLLH